MFLQEQELENKHVSREKDMPSTSKQGYKDNHYLLRDHSNYKKDDKNEKFIKDITLSSDDCKEQPRCDFSALPDEIILEILKNLDKKMLYQVSKVNRRLFIITQDYSLIPHCLNLRDTDRPYINNIICFLPGSIYENVQQLDLTSGNISVSYFVKLLNICGKRLTHLRLRDCLFLKSFALFKISTICKNLKVLDLSCCDDPRMGNGFLCLKKLEFLEALDVSATFITAKSLCKILQKTRRMRNLNLGHVFNWFTPRDQETILIQLKNSCPDLEILDLTGTNLTSRNMGPLIECKNLQKLYFDRHDYELDDSDVGSNSWIFGYLFEYSDAMTEGILCTRVRTLPPLSDLSPRSRIWIYGARANP